MAAEEPTSLLLRPHLTTPAGDSSSLLFWPERTDGGGRWATAAALLIIIAWQLLRALSRRRRRRSRLSSTDEDRGVSSSPSSSSSAASASASASASAAALPPPFGIGNNAAAAAVVSDGDLKELIRSLESGEGIDGEEERWERVIDKKNGQLSYKANCCKPKAGPLKYLSVTVFEDCSTDLLRDFYMDNEYRKEWDKTWVQHEQLQVDETSGTEIGRTIKKFPLLTAREYVLAWRVWEGKDKTFYCFIKDSEHSRAPRQKKYVRVAFFRSGWCIKKVPGRDASEITIVHQEDAGLNVEMAKLAFAKGIWSYVCKMNIALRAYSSHIRSRSTSVITMLRLIQKVPPVLETVTGTTHPRLTKSSDSDTFGNQRTSGNELLRKPSKKWIANGLLLLGGIVCLSRGRSTLGTQIAVACLVKKLLNQEPATGNAEPSSGVARLKRRTRHNY